jgi:hypothetical protein
MGKKKKKVIKNPSQPMAGCSGVCLVIPTTYGSTNRRIVVRLARA